MYLHYILTEVVFVTPAYEIYKWHAAAGMEIEY